MNAYHDSAQDDYIKIEESEKVDEHNEVPELVKIGVKTFSDNYNGISLMRGPLKPKVQCTYTVIQLAKMTVKMALKFLLGDNLGSHLRITRSGLM